MTVTYPPDRQSARLADSLKYFTGRPCPHDHIAPRYTSNGACTECVGNPYESAQQGDRLRRCEKHRLTYSARQCPDCKADWRRTHPPDDDERVQLAEQQRTRVQFCRAYVRSFKEAQPCADCGWRMPWYVMEFDHRDGRGPGDSTVASLIGQGTLDRVILEIEKCDLVCANCHKIRTHKRAVARGERIV